MDLLAGRCVLDTDLITTDEAATRLGRSTAYVLRLLKQGQLEGCRIGPDTRGGQWLIHATSVSALSEHWAANPPRRGRPAVAGSAAANESTPPEPQELDDWIELPEAAERLGRHSTQVRKLAAAGELEARRIGPEGRGGRWLVSEASVEGLLTRWAVAPPRRGRPALDKPTPGAQAKRESRAKHREEVL